MAKAAQKIKLSLSRDIHFDKLVLSQSNVWPTSRRAFRSRNWSRTSHGADFSRA